MQINRYLISLLLCLFTWPIAAQTPAPTPEEVEYDRRMCVEIERQLQRFDSELQQLSDVSNRQFRISEHDLHSSYYIRSLNDKVNIINRSLHALDVRWDAFTSTNLTFMSDNDSLMEHLTNTQLLHQAVTDSIAINQQRCEAIANFTNAERLIYAQDSVYSHLYQQAFRMSLVQKLTPQLEKIKAQEQVRFEQIQASYDASREAALLVPALGRRAVLLDERYYSLKAVSEKIQAMEYKPLIQRIKDYLMGLACVSVLLIFINMIVTKWKAAKQEKETLKKQREILQKNNVTNYPTI